MKKSRGLVLLTLLLAFSLLLAACGMRPEKADTEATPEPVAETTPAPEEPAVSPSAEATAEPVAEATPTPTPEVTPEPKALVNPLTGEPSEKDFSNVRPVAVMLENNYVLGGPPIPMYGINEADILYEMQVEKITRCMGLYMDIASAPQLCPVRSARTYFVGTALAYDAIYVHRGQSAEGVDFAGVTLAEHYTDNDDIDLGDSNSYNIDSYPNTGEHSMCTNGELLTQHFDAASVRTEHKTAGFDYGLHFTEDGKAQGEAANSVRIVFPEYKITSFTYDAAKNGYVGVNFDQPWVDKNTGEVGAFQNLLILDAPTAIAQDMKWHSIINLIDQEGTGYYCNGGCYEPITWKRGAITEPFRYYDANGNELELGIGRTYIGIMSMALGGVTFG